MKVRTRFAPSPTGHLHLGGARTALYNWLWARHCGGELVLRIEDTDLQRSTDESTRVILEAMQWLQLDYDAGPFYQHDQLAYYRSVAEQLIAEGKAYRCYCSKEAVEAERTAQLARKEKPRYGGHCRELNLPATADRPYVIRFKNPTDGVVAFDDQILGHLEFANAELDDLVIIRSDGTPTYNFSVVLDDCRMQITHVIRGADHVNNTPRQINIMRALGYPVPQYAHVPMILGTDGKLLSKRHGATSVLEYQQNGYLPEALINYLVRLGWSHGDQEVFSLPELIQHFELTKIHKAAATFDPKKLRWLNRYYLKALPPELIAQRLQPFVQQQLQLQAGSAATPPELILNSHVTVALPSSPNLTALVLALRERVNTLVEMAERARDFYLPAEQMVYQPKALALLQNDPEAMHQLLQRLTNVFGTQTAWDETSLQTLLTSLTTQWQLPMGELAQPIRAAAMGSTVSPPLHTTLALLGQSATLARLARAIAIIDHNLTT